MHRVHRTWAVLFAIVLVVAPGVVSAATIGGEAFGAFNRYAMDDANISIDHQNTLGANFENLTGGATGGLGLRAWANSSWMFGAAWEPLFLKSESNATQQTLNFNANSFQLTGAYFLPSQTTAKYGLAAGVGFYSISGNFKDANAGTTDITGSGPGFHVMGVGEWAVSRGFALTAGAGYRYADIEIKDSPTHQTANYSGLIGRVGIAVYAPGSTNSK